MLASLAMYDWPEARQATDELWRAIARALAAEGLADIPDQLDRQTPLHEQWRAPDLLVSQTCGYPLTHEFSAWLEVLATPVYSAEGCQGATYTSAIVVHRESSFEAPEQLQGAHAVYNTPDSLSGHLALRLVFAPFARSGRFFGRISNTGGHPSSMRTVASGDADVAAIDCVSFAFCQRYCPEIAGRLRVIAHSPPAPALPYVTSVSRTAEQVEAIRRALATAFADPTFAATRESLFIEGLEFTTRRSYDLVLDLEKQVQDQGYTELA